MALPGSGQITLKQIGTEFGTSPTLKSNYGKGGASASGDITIKEFYGRANRTDSVLLYNGGGFNRNDVGYSIDQQALTTIDENGGSLVNFGGLSWAGCYTTAGGDRWFGFDWSSGLPTELGYWNDCIVEFGSGGITAAYGRYDWYNVNVGGFDLVVNDFLDIYATDSSGYTLWDYVINLWGFTVTFDKRL